MAITWLTHSNISQLAQLTQFGPSSVLMIIKWK